MTGRVVNRRFCSQYDVYVGRPSLLGNPFEIGRLNRSAVIRLFRHYAIARMDMDSAFAEAVRNCKGKTLACWCSPKPCHATVILELASMDEDTLSDGFGNSWNITCSQCGQRSMFINRPGDARCRTCG